MSAIAGVFSRRGAPRRPGEIDEMLAVMASRGPDGTGTWAGDKVTLGYGALHATPESVHEQMPLVDGLTGNVIVADVRLDNRPELINKLGLDGHDVSKIGDGRLLLDAYRTWGEDCVDHLLGDFAFAVWDERRQQLFLARDHFGAKPLTYHASDGVFAFASDSRSVVRLEGVPTRVNRDRVFDYLVGEAEWADITSTFFDEVHRLRPAHTMTASTIDLRGRRYWHLPEPEPLALSSDAEYQEATRVVLDDAVACRLRGRGDSGLSLSGGIDSSSIAVTAVKYGPVRTYSGISSDQGNVETALIRAAMATRGVVATLIDSRKVHEACGDFTSAQRNLESPFSNGALPRTVFTTARLDGCRSVLTGMLADEVIAISAGVAMRAMFQDRQPSEVLRLAASRGNMSSQIGRVGLVRSAIASALELSQHVRDFQDWRRTRWWGEERRQLVRHVRLRATGEETARLHERVDSTRWISRPGDRSGSLRHRLLDGGYGATALERYDRSAAESSVECRSPFMDRRVVEFFQRLPPRQLVSSGWTKSVLRRSMADCLRPEAVWSRHKEHLGWSFTLEWLDVDSRRYLRDLGPDHPLHEYVDVAGAVAATPLEVNDLELFTYLRLALWLEGSAT